MRDSLFAAVQAWQGPSGLIVLTLVCAFGAIVYVPRFSLYLLGGAMFGWAAAPAALIGTTLGAVIAFLLARTLLHDWVRHRIEQRPAINKVFSAIDAESWRLVALTRFASPLPGGAINYLFGVTRIKLWPYTTATFAGLVLPIATFVTLGALGRMALSALDGQPAQQIGIAAAVAMLIVALMLIFRRMKAGAAPVRPAAPRADR